MRRYIGSIVNSTQVPFFLSSDFNMPARYSPEISQETLYRLWHGGQDGRLSAWEVAKALGLREASKEVNGGIVLLPWIAARTTKIGGGHPSTQSLYELFAKVDADAGWHPGKHSGAKRGPKPLFTSAKRRAVASSMMARKHNKGEDPSVEAAILNCPQATMNPKTKKPFSDTTIRDVFTSECYDFDPEHPWRFQNTLQKVFLPDGLKQHRCSMSRHLKQDGPAANWWASEVVWFDPCASIIPGSEKQWVQMRQALKGRKRYISNNAKLYSPNMPAAPTALKQTQWAGTKVNWFMVLTRGVVHVEVMPPEWTLNGEGVAEFVERLPKVLSKMLGDSARWPRHVFTDRGTGLYNPQGRVVLAYEGALRRNGFHLYWGPDASQQSPDMGDMLLHETAVSWFRNVMRKFKPDVLPWEETQAQWAVRARKAVAWVNAEYDVAGLCREFPSRLQHVIDGEGERLRK